MMESMRNLHIVLFIGVMCVVQTMSLVCPYIDSKCTCSSDNVTCNNLEQIPPLNTGAKVIPVSELYFLSGSITSISNNSLPPGLKLIFLYRHPLTNISEDAFDTSAATLQSLNLIGASFDSLPTALKKLTSLFSLHIADTMIQHWDTALLKQIAGTLNSLTLSNVGLSTWPSWIFYIHWLYEFSLSRNFLLSIPDNVFSSMKYSLRFLDLSSTGLTHVPNALSKLESLDTLKLINNNFIHVSEIEKITGFPFAHKLSVLFLDSVGLSKIGNLSNLTSLKIISLAGNRILDVPAGLLPTSLTMLLLNDNYLASVPKVIATMSSLSTLNMDNNRISDIEANSFPFSLINLDMNSNYLNIITNTTFRNLNLLQTLHLDFNPITTISFEAFSDLVSLQTLFISNTHLIEIPLAFARLTSHVDIYFSTTQPLACPCPVSRELVKWFTLVANSMYVYSNCSNGQSITSYLSSQCDPR